jgi:hypothetical protein
VRYRFEYINLSLQAKFDTLFIGPTSGTVLNDFDGNQVLGVKPSFGSLVESCF